MMKKFVCGICGFVYEGTEAPEKCPQCGAPKEKFTELVAGVKEYADEHRVGIAKGVDERILETRGGGDQAGGTKVRGCGYRVGVASRVEHQPDGLALDDAVHHLVLVEQASQQPAAAVGASRHRGGSLRRAHRRL